MIQKVMVTGSSGTVGTALCQSLLQKGYRVVPLDIARSNWDKKIDRLTITHDLRKPVPKLTPKNIPDIIIHLAANARVYDLVVDPQKALDNYVMTHNILEFARTHNVRRFVFASSREVYGETSSSQKRKEQSTHVGNIKSPYTASKYAAESLIHAYRQCYDINSVIVRLSNVYGRFDVSERALPYFIYLAKRNRDIHIFGEEKKLDFTYTDDAVDGLMRIIKRFDKIAPETFNITRGEGAKIKTVAELIISHLNSQSTLKIGAKRTGEISVFVADITKANNLLGYKPKVSIDAGVPLNVDWYLSAMKDRKVYERQRRDLLRRGWA